MAHGHLGGRPPAVDLEAERALAQVLVTAAARGLLAAAHDLSDGGLAVALAESCLARRPRRAGHAAGRRVHAAVQRVSGPGPGRGPAGAEAEFAALRAEAGVPGDVLGTTGGDALEVSGLFAVGLDELAAAHRATLPALFG